MKGKDGVEGIIEKINKEATAKVEEIRKNSAEKVDSIMKHNELVANENADKIRRQGDDEISLIKRQIISNAEIEAKDKIDKVKFNWIENVFEEARQTVLNLEDKEKKKILNRMCDIPDKEKFVFCVDKKYANLLRDMDNIKECEIKDFGVVIKSKDEKIKIDNTLTNHLNMLKQQKRYDIAKILFG